MGMPSNPPGVLKQGMSRSFSLPPTTTASSRLPPVFSPATYLGLVTEG
ncbi:MAG: hypothetical protein K0R83_2355 [Caulobacter sp.]|nr:hypothetical protein [Caulobacter sp.]